VRCLCETVDAVVHCAGAVGVWGPREHFQQANVGQTESVVEACLKQGVRRLVHLSSPSIFDGQSHVGIREEQVPSVSPIITAPPSTNPSGSPSVPPSSVWRCWRCARASSPAPATQHLPALDRGPAQGSPEDHRQGPEQGRFHQRAEPQ
jgi:hypothetical protein